MPLRRRDANAKQLNVRMPPDELKSLVLGLQAAEGALLAAKRAAGEVLPT
jgi:hypothetical protein